MYYLQSRYYDPQTGRFINADAIEILDTAQDHINGLNLFAYCFNNPVNDLDPNGDWSWKKFWKTVGVVVAAVAVVAVVTAAVVLTAGVAAAVMGASMATVGAVMSTAAVGGLVMGGLSIVGQGITNGFDNINMFTVAIDTFSGAAFGALTGGVGVGASIGLRAGVAVGKVALSMTTAGLHAVNEKRYGDIGKDILQHGIMSAVLNLATLGGSLVKFKGVGNSLIKKVVSPVVSLFKSPVIKTASVLGTTWLFSLLTGKYKYIYM